MKLEWSKIKNPILDFEPKCSLRDPALYYDSGTFYLFHSAVEYPYWRKIQFYLNVTTSEDLIHWTTPKRVFYSKAGYSSPGNIFKVDDRFYLCFQTYPIGWLQEFGNNNCRLWLSESLDLRNWSSPKCLSPKGCQAHWATSTRQIDPFVIHHKNGFYCYYKTQGSLGILYSTDLDQWEEIHSQSPIFSKKNTPDNTNIENIIITADGERFLMFFSPCYEQRGIGVAESQDLLDWKFLHYLVFPKFPWAYSGPTAPSIVDIRSSTGKWLMAFHGDRERPHRAVLGLAWSEDLIHWEMN